MKRDHQVNSKPKTGFDEYNSNIDFMLNSPLYQHYLIRPKPNFCLRKPKIVKLNNRLMLFYANHKVLLNEFPKCINSKQVFKCESKDNPLFSVRHKGKSFYGQLPSECPRPTARWIKWIGLLPLEMPDKSESHFSIQNEKNSSCDSLKSTEEKSIYSSRNNNSFVASISVPIYVNSQEYIALIDTGASLSTVNKLLLDKLDKSVIHRISPCKPMKVSLAIESNQSFVISSVAELKVTINGKKLLMPFYVVANAANDFVLGLDWMRAYKVELSMQDSSFVLKVDGKNWRAKTNKPSSASKSEDLSTMCNVNVPNSKYCLKLCSFVEIPPNSIARVPVKSNILLDSEVFVDPSLEFEENNGIIVGANIISLRNGFGETYFTNLSNSPIKLKPDSVVGYANTISPFDIVSQIPDLNVSPGQNVKLASAQVQPDGVDKQISSLKINPNLPPNMKNELLSLLFRFKKVFAFNEKELGCANNAEHVIETNTEQPVKQRPYRVSYFERTQINELVQRMLDDGIVVPSISPYASPVVLVKKADGTMRFCVDYRKLNAITKVNVYPIPRMDDLFDRLNGVKYMSKLDLMMGFHQVPLSKESQEKSAFITPSGLFEFTRMPFGLTNAPATFQRLMDCTLNHLLWRYALVYMDDTLAIGKDWPDHLKSLELILQAILDANLRLKPSKCEFGMQEMEFLGHVISSEGITVNKKKINAVENFPTPSSVKKVRSFVSLCSFYRKFIPCFAKIARPLYDLLSKDAKFGWGPEQQTSFDELKHKLVTAPVLSHYDPNAKTEIHTDACTFGIGAILMQYQSDGKSLVRKTLAYASRSLHDAEKRYHVTELECLAVVFAVETFRPYLYGHPFSVVTDHCSLCNLINLKDPNGRLARWALRLQPYKFSIRYNSGKNHGHVDALSRSPVDPAPEKEITLDDCFVNSQVVQNSDFPNILSKQRSDPQFRSIIESLLESNDQDLPKPKKYIDYELINGVLYKANLEPDSRLWTLCVPKVFRAKLLEDVHIHCGHLGFFKTWCAVKSRYYWPNIYQHVRKFVQACHTCQIYGRRNISNPGPLQPISPPSQVFARIGIDYVGPLPKSEYGNKYIMLMVDHTSRYMEATAVPNITSACAINAILDKVIHRHGYPLEILCDQGRHFISTEFRNFCKACNIKLTFTSVYSPSTNGLCEKANDSLKRILAKRVGDDHPTWDQKLQDSVFAYNSSVHEVTKFSPFYCLFGREPKLKCDLEFPIPEPSNSETLSTRVRRTRKLANERTEKFQSKQKAKYDASHSIREFEVGDLVLHANFEREVGKVTKFLVKWKGSYIIVRKLGPLTYQICRQRIDYPS